MDEAACKYNVHSYCASTVLLNSESIAQIGCLYIDGLEGSSKYEEQTVYSPDNTGQGRAVQGGVFAAGQPATQREADKTALLP